MPASPEWISGTYAGAGRGRGRCARRARRGHGEHVDIAVLDCIAVTMTNFVPVFSSLEGWPDDPGPPRNSYLPGIEPAADGWVGFTAMTWTQIQDYLRLIERFDWAEDRTLATRPGREARRDEWIAATHEWTTKRTTAEIVEQANLWRVPTVAIERPDTVTSLDAVDARGTCSSPIPTAASSQPRRPYLRRRRRARPRAAGAGAQRATTTTRRGPRAPRDSTDERARSHSPGSASSTSACSGPGPTCTQTLAALGADVMKVESFLKPDGVARHHPQARRPTLVGTTARCSTRTIRASDRSASTSHRAGRSRDRAAPHRERPTSWSRTSRRA